MGNPPGGKGLGALVDDRWQNVDEQVRPILVRMSLVRRFADIDPPGYDRAPGQESTDDVLTVGRRK